VVDGHRTAGSVPTPAGTRQLQSARALQDPRRSDEDHDMTTHLQVGEHDDRGPADAAPCTSYLASPL
jgi:hypothetical protein